MNYYRTLLNQLANNPYGTITITTPEQEVLQFKGEKQGVHVELRIKDWKLVKECLLRSDIGLANAYALGYWESETITELFTYCIHNLNEIEKTYQYKGFVRKWAYRIYNQFVKVNSLRGSKNNIAYHYDVSNEFYALWLDASFTYSSGLRLNVTDGLATAQYNKYQRILGLIGSEAKTVLEIGCGWGGFAEQALAKGHQVTGLTISRQQYDYAQKRLKGQATIVFKDYRRVNEQYDAIVSIEMFEAIGQRYWDTYFNILKKSLKPKGKAVIQFITIEEDCFDNYLNSTDFIRHFIFPGGTLISKTLFRQKAEQHGLKVVDEFAFGYDYAWTLKEWLNNFNQAKPELQKQGYPEDWLKYWELYFHYCIAGFRTKRIDVVQSTLTHKETT